MKTSVLQSVCLFGATIITKISVLSSLLFSVSTVGQCLLIVSNIVITTASVSSTNLDILKSLGVDDSDIGKLLSDDEGKDLDLEKEQYGKQRDPEWWRDPLAMFETEESQLEEGNGNEKEIENEIVNEIENSIDGYIQSNEILDDENNSIQNNEMESETITCPIILPNEEDDIDGGDKDEIDKIAEKDITETLDPDSNDQIEVQQNEEMTDSQSSKNIDNQIDNQRKVSKGTVTLTPNNSSSTTKAVSTATITAPALPAIFVITKLRSLFPYIPHNIVALFATVVGTQLIVSHMIPKKHSEKELEEQKQQQPQKQQPQKQKQKQHKRQQQMNMDYDSDIQTTQHTPSKVSMFFKNMKQNLSFFSQNENASDDSQLEGGKDSIGTDKSNDRSEIKPISTNQQMKSRQKNQRQRNISKKEMVEQINSWKERAERAENDNERLIAESDRMNRKMAMIQSESNTLQSSMGYLKSQLRDNQREIERAVLRERQKSENEMAKVRESLIKVLKHERNLMREQVQKTQAQVRALLDEAEHDVKTDVKK